MRAAGADVFGPIRLCRGPPAGGWPKYEQAEDAKDPVISGGRSYVAFDGSFGGHNRRLAARHGERRENGRGRRPEGDAELPSISEDGRYISFTTRRSSTKSDHNEAPDVYVRDMDPLRRNPEAGGCTARLGRQRQRRA